MRTLIWYLRSLFCKHEFEKEEGNAVVYDEFEPGVVERQGVRVSLLCKKCGYHRSFWKF